MTKTVVPAFVLPYPSLTTNIVIDSRFDAIDAATLVTKFDSALK